MGEYCEYEYDEKENSYQLDCCNWRAVTEIENQSLIVTVNNRVYKLINEEINFKSFYEFTQDFRYQLAPLAAERIGVSLQCARCGGDGKTDWVEKVMKKNKNIIPMPHKRDPYGRVLKFRVSLTKNPHISQEHQDDHPFFILGNLTDYLEKGITHQFIYTSLPHLNNYDELCPACYGSGLRIISDNETKLVASER